jgi:hypothetical protein
MLPRRERTDSERFKSYVFWLRDESLEDSTNLPDPDVLALDSRGT